MLDLDRLLNQVRPDPEPSRGRIETRVEKKIPTINDKIISVLDNGNILSCNGIMNKIERRFKCKVGKDTISTLLPKLVKNGEIKRARVHGIYFYWKID